MRPRFQFISGALSALLSMFGCALEPTSPSAIPGFVDSIFNADTTIWWVSDTLGGGLALPTVDADRV